MTTADNTALADTTTTTTDAATVAEKPAKAAPITVASRLYIGVVTSPMSDRTGQRGRPQKHPQVTFDLSGAPAAIEAFGEKKVRNEAARQLRAFLSVGETVPCTQHPKDESLWILKAVCGRDNYAVAVFDTAAE